MQCWGPNLGPLIYKVSVLPLELHLISAYLSFEIYINKIILEEYKAQKITLFKCLKANINLNDH